MNIEYNKDNLSAVIDIIKDNLTQDLLVKKYRTRNLTNPMFGHCHTASACLQRVFGTKFLKLYRALDDEGIWHWWCVDINNTLIDITVDQYLSVGRVPPHDGGQKASMLGFGYRTRVLTLYDRVINDMTIKNLFI
jgi:hypothetical protein